MSLADWAATQRRNAGCPITLTTGQIRDGAGYKAALCAEPIVANGLCARHEHDRIRLLPKEVKP